MNRLRAKITESAIQDLNTAARYISKNLMNPQAASDLLDSFDALVLALENTAHVYPFVRDEVAKAAGYRWAEIGNYMVFFRVDNANTTVYIERIAYKKRNWISLLVE